MEMSQAILADDIVKVSLVGSLDIEGSAKVDLPLSVLAGSIDRMAIDLRGVQFLASIGVRTLITVARTIHKRGGRVVLIGPNEATRSVLGLTGIDTVMAIAHDDAEALSLFR